MIRNLLLKLYEDFSYLESHRITAMYSKIANGFAKKKYKKNSIQCRRKMKSLTDIYKHTLDHNRGTGNDPKTCAYYKVS